MAAIIDPSHLIKSIRNALLNNKSLKIHPEFVKAFNLFSDEVKWDHIVKLFDFDFENKLKIAPHLKKHYIQIGHFGKMKVNPAVAVLSKATGHALRWLHCQYPDRFGKEYLTTALFCEKMGEYHEIVNNHKRSLALHADQEEKNAEMMATLDHILRFYCTMKLHPNQRDTELKPSQKGMIMTNNSVRWLKGHLLNDLSFKYFLTARINNDTIEGFHGEERDIQKNPTAKQFKENAKIISVSHFMGHGKGRNCDTDEHSKFVTSLSELKKMRQEEQKASQIELKLDIAFLKANGIKNWSETCSLAYFVGYLLKKVILNKKKPCMVCKEAFVGDADDNRAINSLIVQKENKEGALTRPSKLATRIFIMAENLLRSANVRFSKETGLTDRLTKQVVAHVKSNVPDVPKCHLELIFRRFVKCQLFFDGEFTDSKLQVKNKKMIEGKTNASKTAKAVALQ